MVKHAHVGRGLRLWTILIGFVLAVSVFWATRIGSLLSGVFLQVSGGVFAVLCVVRLTSKRESIWKRVASLLLAALPSLVAWRVGLYAYQQAMLARLHDYQLLANEMVERLAREGGESVRKENPIDGIAFAVATKGPCGPAVRLLSLTGVRRGVVYVPGSGGAIDRCGILRLHSLRGDWYWFGGD